MKENVQIYVSCHKESYFPQNNIISPIQVGRKLASKDLEGMIGDDTGENISYKNKSYCELTAQYWVWKNKKDLDYYGFFHYRRYLSFKNEYFIDKDDYNVKPYITYNKLNEEILHNIGVDEANIMKIVSKYDIVVPMRERNNCSAYEQYKTSKFHNIEDLDTVIDIIKEKYPEYGEAMNKYLLSNEMYYCNMFIMKKEIFNDYCSWLFDILYEHEKRRDLSEYSVDEYRVSGFLGERLFGIYYTYLKQKKIYKCCELQRVDFKDTEPKPIINPIYNENEIPIVFSCNDDFVPYLSVTIQSIMDNSNIEMNYDVIVLHKDISESNQLLLKKMTRSKSNFSIRFCNTYYLVDNKKFFVDKHLSEETYYRLFIMDLLPRYKKVLYLDCDIVVNEDVAELFLTDIDDYLLGAVRDIDYAGNYKANEERRQYTKDIIKLDNAYDYFQAGVLIMNLENIRKEFTVNYLIEVALSYKWKHHDQDVLNHLCEGKVRFLDMSWNVIMNWKSNFSSRMDILKLSPRNIYNEYLASRFTPKIVHYAGYQKPWKDPSCDYAEDFWVYARRTYFYEIIMQNMLGKKNNSKRNLKLGEKAVKIKVTNKSVFIDMRKINEMFPPGSKRRMVIKNLAKIIYK